MYTLITGATGLVGRYLLRDLLLNGHQLAVVVRGSRRMDPEARIEQIMQYWEREHQRSLPRPVVIEGDISQPGFGISEEGRDWISRNVNRIIHSAAILEFFGKDREAEPWRTNYHGTRHMLDLCRETGIRDLHYVSTAYVCGLHDGIVQEDSLERGQTFRNDYEESKYEAEKLVRAADFAEHITVYRPAVICGDSRTGYTNTYHGLFVYLRLMAMLIPSLPKGPEGLRVTPIRLKFTGREPRNLIPVDWVSAVMTRVFENPDARDLTYHMAPDNPITSRQLIDLCSEYFETTGVMYEGDPLPEAWDESLTEDQRMFDRLFQDNADTYAAYESTDPKFDMTNTKRFAGDIICPELDRTVLHRFIDYGNEDRWGKRRPEWTKPQIRVGDLLRSRIVAAEESSQQIGINVLGQGGVQATLVIADAGILSVSPGLSDSVPVLTVTHEDLLAVLSGQKPAADLSSLWDQCSAEQAAVLTDKLVAACGESDAIRA